MSRVLSTLGGVVGMVLASVLVASTMVLLGLSPVLGLLAGAVVAVDLRFYRQRAGEDAESGRQDLTA